MTTSATGDLDWLLANLTETVENIHQAVIFSADGLVMGVSPGLAREDAEHLAALAAGVQSLARGAGQRFRGGNVRQTIIEMDAVLGRAPAWPCWPHPKPTPARSPTR